MLIFFVWLIAFGIGKIFFVQDTLSNNERVEIQEKIKNALSECQDPLNKGRKFSVYINHNQINSICYLIRENVLLQIDDHHIFLCYFF